MTDQPGENPAEPTPEPTSESAPTPPPAAPTPPPAAPTPPPAGATGSSSGGASYDMAAAKETLQGANQLDLGMIAAGVVAFFASMLPFYTASVSAGGFSASGHASAWHGFFGWFAALVALAMAVLVALPLFKVNLSLPLPLSQLALGGFVLALVCTVLALFVFPGGASCSDVNGLGVSIHCDTGRGFGYWLMLLCVLAGTALAFMRSRDSMAKTA